jgi:hypothetical protein
MLSVQFKRFTEDDSDNQSYVKNWLVSGVVFKLTVLVRTFPTVHIVWCDHTGRASKLSGVDE